MFQRSNLATFYAFTESCLTVDYVGFVLFQDKESPEFAKKLL